LENKKIKVGMKVNLTPAIRHVGGFWSKYIGKTFEVIIVSEFNIQLITPKGCKYANTSVSESAFWDYFALANTQLEFDFGK
jgi:hypothetical protein